MWAPVSFCRYIVLAMWLTMAVCNLLQSFHQLWGSFFKFLTPIWPLCNVCEKTNFSVLSSHNKRCVKLKGQFSCYFYFKILLCALQNTDMTLTFFPNFWSITNYIQNEYTLGMIYSVQMCKVHVWSFVANFKRFFSTFYGHLLFSF